MPRRGGSYDAVVVAGEPVDQFRPATHIAGRGGAYRAGPIVDGCGELRRGCVRMRGRDGTHPRVAIRGERRSAAGGHRTL